jgi:hypothetical protein
VTYLELVNDVLEMLREDEASDVTESDYVKLIANFVNKAKRKVENAWQWQRLRTTVRVQTVAGEQTYVLTGAGKRFELLKRNDDTFDVYDDTNDVWLRKAPSAAWMSAQFNDNNAQSGIPQWFDFNGYDSNYDPKVELFFIPAGEYYINFNLYVPQDDLVDNTDVMVCPDMPVVYEAYRMAIKERGEDGGDSYQEAREEAHYWLNQEITREAIMSPELYTARAV